MDPMDWMEQWLLPMDELKENKMKTARAHQIKQEGEDNCDSGDRRHWTAATTRANSK